MIMLSKPHVDQGDVLFLMENRTTSKAAESTEECYGKIKGRGMRLLILCQGKCGCLLFTVTDWEAEVAAPEKAVALDCM